MRPATHEDLPSLAALQAASDTHWFGAPESDASEVRQSLERAVPLAERSVLWHDGDHLVAAVWWAGPKECSLLVDPAVDSSEPLDALLPLIASAGVTAVDALDRDTPLLGALARHGWTHALSSYELLRGVADLPVPTWPAGVRVTGLEGHAEQVWDLVYRRAGWAQVPGHEARGLEDWRGLFLSEEVLPAQQVLAWDGEDLAGVAVGKTFSDGTGWVAQLAVAGEHQGRGLGRALLLEAFGRRVAAGATQLGLGVSATNRDALRLYLSVGLTIDREWRQHTAPRRR